MSKDIQDLKRTPLYEKHVEMGAKIVPFSGWSMPVQYSGIIDEHLHTRSKAGLFDICHMGEFLLKGSSVVEDLNNLVTCRIDDMPDGRCRYGFLLNDNGGIIDDLIVFRISAEEFMLVVNAGTIEKDSAWIKDHLSGGTEFIDESKKTAKLDLQGPLSGEIISEFTDKDTIYDLKRYNFTQVEIEGVKVLLSRTGYTGELGYELFFSADSAFKLWDLLIKAGGVKPVGLGARDTLRMEMGYSLYGNDIDEDSTPLEANLSRFVCMEKDFIGKSSILRKQEDGVDSILTGFICEGRRSARSHFGVFSDKVKIGEVTSGSFSPCLKKGIGLCYINKEFSAEGTDIIISDGKMQINATTKAAPIYNNQE